MTLETFMDIKWTLRDYYENIYVMLVNLTSYMK